MTSKTRVLKVDSGVVLKEVTLQGQIGPLAVGYAISTKRSPEEWTTGNPMEANRLFDEEVARCAQAKDIV